MKPNRSLRVLTLNTWKNEGDYEARIAAMGAGLAALDLDIVLLQEVFRTAAGTADTGRALAESLRMALAYAPARVKKRTWRGREVESESGLAVLVRGKIENVASLSLPSDERGGERIAMLADAFLANGLGVLVGCTHLSHLRGDSVRRRQQLETVLAHPRWREPADARVLGGDFNATRDTAELTWLAEHGVLQVNDVFSGTEPCAATHPVPAREGTLGRCIDFMFTVGRSTERVPTVSAASVALEMPIDGVRPSDHAAVMAELQI